MYKMCKTEHSAQRQRALEHGLMKTMLTSRYEDISVSDLCDRLQIPRKAFYRYFASKDGALNALVDHTLMDFVGFQHANPRTVQLDLEEFFQFWLNRRELLDALVRSNMAGLLIQRAVAYSLTDEILPRRFLPLEDEQMQRQIVSFGVCGLMSMVLTWHGESFRTRPGELARIAARILSQPLFPSVQEYV